MINHNRYRAVFTILLPQNIKDLPFYNNLGKASDAGTGSLFAEKISKDLFDDFDKVWDKSDFDKLKPYLNFKIIRKWLSFKIEDTDNQNKAIKEGIADSIADAVANYFIDKVEEKIKPYLDPPI
jgi:hypothetical protein